MSVKIAVITDLHYAREGNCACPDRQGVFARNFLLQALQYLRLCGDIDLLCLGGDLLNQPQDALLLPELAQALEGCGIPFLAVPGNHDPAPEQFRSLIQAPDYIDCKGVRVIAFPDDPGRPGWNATRTAAEFARARRLSHAHPGPLVFLQHVPVFPPGQAENIYGYDNADEIVALMRECGCRLSLSGHQHHGVPTLEYEGMMFACTPALCEPPFPFQIFTLEQGAIRQEQVCLQSPSALALSDFHTHTPFAYCNEDMDCDRAAQMLDLLNLQQVAVTEHSGHLYLSQAGYWQSDWHLDRISDLLPGEDRTQDYLRYLQRCQALDARFLRGTEVDVNARGQLLLGEPLAAGTQLRLGAIHRLPELPPAQAADCFLMLAQALICSGQIHILAHPFRVFSWNGQGEKPRQTFAPLIRMLRQNKVAVEINFHHNRPDREFVRECLAAGIKLSFGSDAHAQWELGAFAWHREFLRQLGYDGDISSILFRWQQ
ncbi:MAG: hypothetical protein GX564_13360 [Oligosphaeraceae bacterium]|nr:hypothetical protein [Oligosphaeraceae bacterium]